GKDDTAKDTEPPHVALRTDSTDVLAGEAQPTSTPHDAALSRAERKAEERAKKEALGAQRLADKEAAAEVQRREKEAMAAQRRAEKEAIAEAKRVAQENAEAAKREAAT